MKTDVSQMSGVGVTGEGGGMGRQERDESKPTTDETASLSSPFMGK